MTISKASLQTLSLKKLQYTTPINDIPDAAVPTATDVGTSRPFNNGSATITLVTPTTGGPATSYTVTSSPGSFTATGSSPLTVTGLQSNTSYTFTSVGNSALGSSYLPSIASNSITATTVPDAPIIGIATKVSNTVASLTFTPPASGGSNITGYTITSSPSISITTGAGTTSPLTATGAFAGGQSYTFTILATNANGNSLSSSASPGVIITETSVPAKPAAPTVTTAAEADTVTWVAPANGGSTITGYTWASSDGKTGTVNGTTLSVVVTQEGNTSQTYTVYATNAIGNSLTSDPSGSVTTPPFFPSFGPFFPPFFPFFPPFFPFFPPFFPFFPPFFPFFPPFFPFFPFFPRFVPPSFGPL
jgi:hypothetical protein